MTSTSHAAGEQRTRVRAYAPASIGNFAAGFDLLGAALAGPAGELWGDVVEARVDLAAAEPSCEACGPFQDRLPPPAENLVLEAHRRFGALLAATGQELPRLRLRLSKNLPVASGLGSSASSIVATLVALNALVARPLASGDLLALAGATEGCCSGAVHLDNVAPSLLGGLRLTVPGGAAVELPFPPSLAFVVVSPRLEVRTAAARAVLPAAVPLAGTVAFAENLSALVHALHAGDLDLLARTLRDPLIEEHRAALVPGFRAAQAAALTAGALGCSLSGSGPALFAVAPPERLAAIGAVMVAALAAAGLDSTARRASLDRQGARLLPAEGGP